MPSYSTSFVVSNSNSSPVLAAPPYQSSSCFSITIHNMLPEMPSNGVHVPFHTIVMEPFQHSFTFGSTQQEVPGGTHIGMDSEEEVAGAFIGSHGFMVMSANHFVILTPKCQQLSLGAALFPRKETHTPNVGQHPRGAREAGGGAAGPN